MQLCAQRNPSSFWVKLELCTIFFKSSHALETQYRALIGAAQARCKEQLLLMRQFIFVAVADVVHGGVGHVFLVLLGDFAKFCRRLNNSCC